MKGKRTSSEPTPVIDCGSILIVKLAPREAKNAAYALPKPEKASVITTVCLSKRSSDILIAMASEEGI